MVTEKEILKPRDPGQQKDQIKTGPILACLVLWSSLLLFIFWTQATSPSQIPYSDFLAYLKDKQVKQVIITRDRISGTYTDKAGKDRTFVTWEVKPELARQLSENNVKFRQEPPNEFLEGVLSWVIPIFLFVAFWSIAAGGMMQQAERTGNPFSFGKSRARIYKEEDIRVTFADVAGVDEAKEELTEIIDFLKNPARYHKIGGRLPKGVLLVGPPGTGKTLMARAVAGEAHVPFFSISGSEFVELFVGVGAARVRDLFQQASGRAPCIIFIDELDALGRARGVGPLSSTHDEKEQTLNQLLSELDGFDPKQGVILLAATNRPEILDPALLRAGRFDRQVLVDRPDRQGRVQILAVHLKTVSCDETVDRDQIACMTPGFTGADLANLVNEAALLATRRGGEFVSMDDFNRAIERIIAGLEKKNRLLNPIEKERVAHHEMGHALVAMSVSGSDPVHKVSVIPRGIGALGYTIQRPLEDRFLMSQDELEGKLTVLLGGRAAEMLVFHMVSTGASDDLAKATVLARNMVTRFGMDEKLGMVTYDAEPSSFLPTNERIPLAEHNYSQETAKEIDRAVKGLIDAAYKRAFAILQEHHTWLELSAKLLVERETLSRDEILAVRPAIEKAAHRLRLNV